jgi:hypothetical protein
MTTRNPIIVPVDAIAKRITLIRNQRVIIDADLASLYGVSTSAFNQAVKRNKARFPEDFMFRLSEEELEFWRSQVVMSNVGARMGLRRAPYAFTEHGAYMAGNVLRSKRAVEVSVYVVRAFVQLRDLLSTHKTLARQLAELDRRVGRHDKVIAGIVADIHRLLEPPPEPKKRSIGFHTPDDDD